jgi:hypothetical protein
MFRHPHAVQQSMRVHGIASYLAMTEWTDWIALLRAAQCRAMTGHADAECRRFSVIAHAVKQSMQVHWIASYLAMTENRPFETASHATVMKNLYC